MNGVLKLFTAPTVEPVSSAEAKLHCRIDTSADDTLITMLIAAARRKVEADANRALITQTWELVLDVFPTQTFIELPLPPLQSVSSIKYYDNSASPVETTFASTNYLVCIDNQYGGLIVLKDSASWPVMTNPLEKGAVRIKFVCGYGAAAAVPEIYKQAMLLLIGHWYENREAIQVTGAVPKEVPLAYEALIWQERVKKF